ncbi:MAG: malto-oligosyltrehalose trehalohydrolase, partial [Acidobacteriota bacterium]|nr:malto-oligosyltrehalose trehalohydrolase [Acidobacteriota bacterium]
FGAEVQSDGSVRFRLWAPAANAVSVSLADGLDLPLNRREDGWFEMITSSAKAGDLYQYRVNGDLKVPDPASRFQPQDVHGPSQIVNPNAFQWTDADAHWRGRPWEEVVIYELHVGTFSTEGTFAGVEARLDYLVDVGITAVELMPVSDFPGTRNWGYDGVLPFAPDSSYGQPEDLKRLVQAAHSRGLMIFLDVVYNHFGPDGDYLRAYAPQFFTGRHATPWGPGINFDGKECRNVRDFFIHNALYWLEEYHFDGLRLDAVHAILDDSKPHILIELAETVRRELENDRHIHLVLENGANSARYLTAPADQKTQWYNAQWNDDIHHSFHVLLTGETDGYYGDYAQNPAQNLGRCLSEGFAYQGEISKYEGNVPRGEPSRDLPLSSFISFIQNHDQVGNRAFGERISALTEPAALKAAAAILLLAPAPPLLFMGEEFAASTPFLFFCDFKGDLAKAVRDGRREEFSRFAKFSSPETRERIPDPNSERTFLDSKLDWHSLKQKSHSDSLAFCKSLLALRQAKIVPHLRGATGSSSEFKVHGESTLSVQWKLGDNSELTLVANLDPAASVAGPLPCKETPAIYASDSSVAAAIVRGAEKIPLPPWFVAWFLSA